MKLILNLLLFLVVFGFARRALVRLLTRNAPPPSSGDARSGYPESGQASGRHTAFDKDEVIEDAEFEEID